MMYLLFFSIATIGLTNIIVHGKIMDVIGLRQWIKRNVSKEVFMTFECYECMGFWAGMLVGFLQLLALGQLGSNPMWFLIPLCGFAGSVLSQTFTDAIYLLRSKIEYTINDAADTGGNDDNG